MRRFLLFPLLLAPLLAAAPPARAAIQIGQKGPNFTKNELVGSSAGPAVSLYDYADRRVIILFLLGYS